MEKDEIEAAVLRAFEVSLEAQLKAVKRLQSGEPAEKPPRKGTSQVDMVYDVLKRAGRPLHVNEIIDRVEKLTGGSWSVNLSFRCSSKRLPVASASCALITGTSSV